MVDSTALKKTVEMFCVGVHIVCSWFEFPSANWNAHGVYMMFIFLSLLLQYFFSPHLCRGPLLPVVLCLAISEWPLDCLDKDSVCRVWIKQCLVCCQVCRHSVCIIDNIDNRKSYAVMQHVIPALIMTRWFVFRLITGMCGSWWCVGLHFYAQAGGLSTLLLWLMSVPRCYDKTF